MKRFKEELIFYGDDLTVGRFPEQTDFIYPNPPLEPIDDPDSAINAALDSPIGSKPIEAMVNADSRVTIAFDDPCVPVPLMADDIRRRIIRILLFRLLSAGVSPRRIKLVCANGLHRKWTPKELRLIIGKAPFDILPQGSVTCHDGTDPDQLVYLGSTSSGAEVEVNKAVTESDLLIYVNINFTSMNGGAKSVLVGLGSWRSIRHHHTPVEWNGRDSIMDPANSPMHKILWEMFTILSVKANIFQIETVVTNELWPQAMGRLLEPISRGDGDDKGLLPLKKLFFKAASVTPYALKKRIRNKMRSFYRLAGIFAGETSQVHERTLKLVSQQHDVSVDKPYDIVVFGVPNLSPYAALSEFNPILLRSLVLGYLFGMFKGAPLVREGGVIIAVNPGHEKFHPFHHPSYVDFWQSDCLRYREPEECWDKLAEAYARDPAYIEAYRDRYAYHGAHVLMNWCWSGSALRYVKAVILAGARSKGTAEKIGFIPADDLESAFQKAYSMIGSDASIAYPVMPPLFVTTMGKRE